MPEQKERHTYENIQVAKTTGVRFFTSVDPGSYVPGHWHPAIEIIYILEGELTITVESSSRQIYAGQCVLINDSVIHATKCTSPNTAIVFQIPMEFIQLYIPDVQQYQFALDESRNDPVYQTKLERFKQTLVQMQIANDVRPKGFVLRFNSLLFEVLYQLYHNFSVKVFQTNLTQRAKDLTRLNTVLKYTRQHYNRVIPIKEIAQVAFLEEGYFCRFFKKCMGTTFLEYQNELRLSHIYQDLISTEDTLQQILEKHGFTNYKLFRRVFYEHFQTTPGKLRKQLKANHSNE